MKRQADIREISDGRLYGVNDMVKADTGGCAGCSECCHGMGTSAILDPYDAWRISVGLGRPFGEFLDRQMIELNVSDGIVLPNLKMAGAEEACAFLSEQGRCRIHAFRPGVCRLFPLGRYYEGRDFRYFLQVQECSRNRVKVKVKKWLDTPEVGRYEEYIRQWHSFLEDVQRMLDTNGNDSLRTQVDTQIVRIFFLNQWEAEDFYGQFAKRLEEGRHFAGLARSGYAP